MADTAPEFPLEISFKDIEQSDAIERRVKSEAAKLEKVYPRITGCTVVVAAPHLHHQSKGGCFHVRIDITYPGEEVVINREPEMNLAHEDVYVAIRDAFQSAKRILREAAEIKQGKIKSHEVPPHGSVARLFPYEGYGFIETPDGREIYFHKNSVLGNKYDQLEVGSEVRFVEEMGDKGPQASTVTLVGKHHVT